MEATFYLKNLVIQNFATFKNQAIKFRPGFNAIVGETGSGKSLVLDALQLILGSRADKKVVRRDTEYSLIEASFHCQDEEVQQYLEAEGFPSDGKEIIIKRLVYKNGATKTYINHLSTTVSFLSTFARKYIDLVGQFENQKLLSESYQLQLLDQFGKHKDRLEAFQSSYRSYRSLQKQMDELEQNKHFREQRLDYLNYQLSEIEKLNPSSQDEEDLLKRKNILVNIEKNQRLAFQMKDIFEGGEGQTGLLSQAKMVQSLIFKNRDLLSDKTEVAADIEDRLQSLYQAIEKSLDVDADPEELEQIIERLDLYQKLKKKFGGTVESLIQTQVEFLKEKENLQSLDINLGDLIQQKDLLLRQLKTHSDELHLHRLKQAKKMEQELTSRIRNLKMNGATVKINLEKLTDFNEAGCTKAFFTAETNPGENFHKIKDIASGGELSRILLAVRQILSSSDSISIFLFDEIDTGIGGETAHCIGKALSEVAHNGQVIAITHLPQIAQFAESMIIVQKDIHQDNKEARTESVVREISGKMIHKEVRAMSQLN